MPRAADIPPCPGPPAHRSTGRITRAYAISVKTPLFGGGVEAGQPDESMPIRATAIRGQLQFWWRATRGARFSGHRELFARHAEVWGSVGQDRARRSPVEVSVDAVSPASARPCARHEPGTKRLRWNAPFHRTALPYALFPFQGKPPSPKDPLGAAPAHFIERASFDLHLRFPAELEPEVDAAVWAWANFGGLGSRTRRGCGALLCKELAPEHAGDIPRWFREGCRGFDPPGGPRAWPTLPASILVATRQPSPPVDAWNQVIELLRHFRQGPGFGRNPGTRRPGRSRYPEPETIRRATRTRSAKHRRLDRIPDDAFPRAELGLPIVFHFQDQRGEEPRDTFLYPAGSGAGQRLERMASPLILRPLVLQTGQAVPLVLRLVTEPLTAVELQQQGQGSSQESIALDFQPVLRGPGLAAYPDSPLRGAPSGSALDAFLALARGRSYTEVTR